jgi:hypothetical protein
VSVAAQPGANMDLPSLTGDVLDRGALNSGFNMLATTLQAQSLLFANPAFLAQLEADAEARRQAAAQLQAELQARGEQTIANGRASTHYNVTDDKKLEPAVRQLFGFRGQNTPLVPVGLSLFRQYVTSVGLAQDDVADAGALLIGTCYEIFTGQAGAVHERALADLRERARKDLLADPLFQGMDDLDRQLIYDIFGVWTVQASADYHEFTTRLAESGNQVQAPTTREALAHLRGTCASMLESSLGAPADRIRVIPSGFAVDG